MFRASDFQNLINQFGRSSTLRTKTSGAYDPATGTVTGSTSTDYTVKCYLYDYRLDEIDNSNVITGDRKVALPAKDTSGNALPEPEVNDQIVGIGDTVSIVTVSKIYSGDTLVCYLGQVRE